MDGIKCQVILSLETLARYESALTHKEGLILGNFIDTCVESFFKDRGVENEKSPFKVKGEINLGTTDSRVSDPALQIQLLGLQHAEAARAREFQRQMEQDKYAREDRREERKEKRTDDFIINLGNIVARAVIASEKEEKNETD